MKLQKLLLICISFLIIVSSFSYAKNLNNIYKAIDITFKSPKILITSKSPVVMIDEGMMSQKSYEYLVVGRIAFILPILNGSITKASNRSLTDEEFKAIGYAAIELTGAIYALPNITQSLKTYLKICSKYNITKEQANYYFLYFLDKKDNKNPIQRSFFGKESTNKITKRIINTMSFMFFGKKATSVLKNSIINYYK